MKKKINKNSKFLKKDKKKFTYNFDNILSKALNPYSSITGKI